MAVRPHSEPGVLTCVIVIFDPLHRLFGEAISLAILGASEEDAMAGFKEAWDGRHKEWQHHLNYSDTDW